MPIRLVNSEICPRQDISPRVRRPAVHANPQNHAKAPINTSKCCTYPLKLFSPLPTPLASATGTGRHLSRGSRRSRRWLPEPPATPNRQSSPACATAGNLGQWTTRILPSGSRCTCRVSWLGGRPHTWGLSGWGCVRSACGAALRGRL